MTLPSQPLSETRAVPAAARAIVECGADYAGRYADAYAVPRTPQPRSMGPRNAFERAMATMLEHRDVLERALAPIRELSQLQMQQRVAHEAKVRQGALDAYLTHARALEAIQVRSLSDELQRQTALATEAARLRQFEMERNIVADLATQARHRTESLFQQRLLEPLSVPTLQRFLSAQNVSILGANAIFERAARAALGPWAESLERGLLEELQRRLVDEARRAPDEATAIDLPEMVANAVVDALAALKTKVDWKFLVGIIIAILIFLYQDHTDSEMERRLTDRIGEVKERLEAQEYLFDLLTSKAVARKANLLTNPKSSARKIAVLEPGQLVVVLERKGKWTRVAVMSAYGNGRKGVVGWLRNKYLE